MTYNFIYSHDNLDVKAPSKYQSPNFVMVLTAIYIAGVIFSLVACVFIFFWSVGTIKRSGYLIPIQKTTSPTVQTEKSFSYFIGLAQTSFASGNYQAMLNAADQALSISKTPKEKAGAYYYSGLAKYNLGKLEDAEKDLLQATILDITFAKPYSTLGAISLQRQDIDKLFLYSNKCLSLDPNLSWCHNNLGIAYLLSGDKTKGLEEMQKAISLDPTNLTFQENLKRAKASNP